MLYDAVGRLTVEFHFQVRARNEDAATEKTEALAEKISGQVTFKWPNTVHTDDIIDVELDTIDEAE